MFRFHEVVMSSCTFLPAAAHWAAATPADCPMSMQLDWTLMEANAVLSALMHLPATIRFGKSAAINDLYGT